MDIETAVFDFAYGQAATVQADEPFGQDIGFEFVRERKPNRAVEPVPFDFDNGHGCHNVSAHDVSADFVAETCRPFDVDAIAFLQQPQIGFAKVSAIKSKLTRFPSISVIVRQQPLLATDAPCCRFSAASCGSSTT